MECVFGHEQDPNPNTPCPVCNRAIEVPENPFYHYSDKSGLETLKPGSSLPNHHSGLKNVYLFDSKVGIQEHLYVVHVSDRDKLVPDPNMENGWMYPERLEITKQIY